MIRGVRICLLLAMCLLVVGTVSAAVVTDDLHLNLQTTYSNGSIETGTFDFAFNITTDTSCTAVVYSNLTTLTTDSRGIISYYLPDVTLDYDQQYYLCYYRDGSLKSSAKVAKVPYAFRANNITLSGIEVDSNLNMTGYNVTADTGFFSWLGGLSSRITTLFVQDIDFSGEITGTGNVTADWFKGKYNWSETSEYLSFDGSQLDFDETKLNATINAIDASSTYWTQSGTSVYYDLGNVGIGSGASPATPLHIKNATGETQLRIQAGDASGAATLQFFDSTGAEISEIYTDLTDNDLRFQAGNADILTLESSGFVGIGTTDPDTLFHIQNATGYTEFRLTGGDASSGGAIQFYNSSGEAAEIYSHGLDDSLRLQTANQDRITVDSSGNVGIGTSSPQNLLNVDGDANVTGTLYRNNNPLIDWGEATNGTLAFNSTFSNYYTKSESNLINTSMKNYVNSEDLRYNNSIANYVNTENTRYNTTIANYVNTENTRYNTSMFGYVNAQDTIFNNSIASYVNSEDLRYNNSIASWVTNVFATLNEPLWTSNYTSYNDSWTTTDAEIWSVASNDTFVPYTGANSNIVLGDNNLSVGGTDFFVNNNNGKVGIGTASPTHLLTIGALEGVSSTNASLSVKTGTGSSQNRAIHIEEESGSESYYLGVNSIGDLQFWNSNIVVPTMILGDDGDVGIGTSSPDGNLHISDGTSATTAVNRGLHITHSSNYPRIVLENPTETTGKRVWDMFVDDGLLEFRVLNDAATGEEIPNVLTLDSGNGNVGIGTIGPLAKLHVVNDSGTSTLAIDGASGSDAWLQFREAGTGKMGLSWDASESELIFFDDETGGNPRRMVIEQTGNVGIGTTSPSVKLHLNGSTYGASALRFSNDYGGNTDYWDVGERVAGAGDHYFSIEDSGTNRFTIDDTGNVGIGTSTPQNLLNVDGDANVTGAFYTDSLAVEENITIGGAWQDGGVTIDNGKVYAQELYVYNITGLNVTDLNINGSLLPQAGYDNTFDIGSEDLRWRNLELGGDANVTGTLYVGDIIRHQHDSDTYIDFNDDSMTYMAGNVQMMKFTESSTDTIVFNENGADVDFRVEGSGEANALFVRGSDGKVGIGTTSPDAELDVEGDIAVTNAGGKIRFYGTDGGGEEGITYSDSGGTQRYGLFFPGSDVVALANRASNGVVNIRANTATAGSGGEVTAIVVEDDEVQLLPNGGNVGIGTTTPGSKLEVNEGDIWINNTADSNLRFYGDISGAEGRLADISFANGGDSVAAIQVYREDADDEAYLKFMTQETSGGGVLERMRIQGDGNVGIGTSSPSYKLQVAGGDIKIDNNEQILQADSGGTVRNLASLTSDDIYRFGNAIYNNLTSSNVGIGTTSPSAKLDIESGDISTLLELSKSRADNMPMLTLYTSTTDRDSSLSFATNSGNQFIVGVDASDSDKFKISDAAELGTGDRLTIDSSGNVGIGTTSPSDKLDVVGNISMPYSSSNAYRIIQDGANNWFGGIIPFSSSGYQVFQVEYDGNGGGFLWEVDDDEKMRLNANGRLGLGTNSPQTNLDISSDYTSVVPTIRITDENDGATVVGDVTGMLEFYSEDTSSAYPKRSGAVKMEATNIYGSQYRMVFDVGDTGSTPEIMTLTSGGNVGIGTVSPSELLEISKDESSDTPTLRITNLKSDYGSGGSADTVNGAIEFFSTEASGNGNTVRSAIKGLQQGGWGAGGSLAFYTDYDSGTLTENMRIESTTGYIGINTTTPQNTLNVVGDLNVTGTIYNGDGDSVIGGSGTANYIPIWSDEDTLTDSSMSDDGDTITIDLS